MMASEVAPSSPSPFGCSGYQNLVDDEIDLWVHQPGWKKEEERKDKWARAREIVFPKQVEGEGEVSNVSSLVQKWRGLEASNKVMISSSSSSPCPCGGAGDDAESIGDWESDRTGPSTRDSDFSESERMRVADIIRRLTEDVESSPPRVRTTDNHNQYSDPPLSPVVGSPRIRGRQAYVDLLTQMERDRRKELERLGGRKAVSQFSHRGRIQALLRIKSLRRGLGAMEGRFSNSSIPPDLPKPKPSTLRLEATTAHPAILKQQCLAQLHQVPTPFTNYNQESDQQTTTTSDQDAQESNGNQQDTACWVHEREVVISCKGDWIGEVTNWDTNNQETDQQTTTASDQDAQESNGNQQDTACWVSELHEQEVISCKGDWIGEVSRPRSDWEDLRQARYQEMLDPFLENEEIRALLGRKSVSAFLSSGLKEKIDQVMMFRAQAGQAQAVVKKNADHGVVEEEEMKEKHEEEEEHSEYNLEEFEEGDKSSVEQQYTAESDEYMASPAASWPQINQAGHESSTYSSFDQAACTPTPSNGQTSSYGAHPAAAIEMELMYDLRRHMEQLHQEMSELRKSIKCCTDMQVKLQRSIKKEVTTVLTNPGPVRKGRRCSVCRKVQVDCVLYRCGHMCTCFRCGHELQWSSGKCPVCKAPIVDVVRTYSNY